MCHLVRIDCPRNRIVVGPTDSGNSHVNSFKYTCPRCGIHTCSLPCVKLHKRRAQCSGVRDPTRYRNRSQLATAASIDQDFNFIATVERSLQHAENEINEKKLNPTSTSRPRSKLPSHSRFEPELDNRGIQILRAPKGLSRSKQNTSHWDGQHNCILWTVEWVLQDTRRVIAHCRETLSVLEAFRRAVGKTLPKRKRPAPDLDANNAEVKQEEHLQADAGDGQTSPAAPINFYLHRPRTNAKFKCLVPIAQGVPLIDALRNRTLIEFPTIYVRDEGPDHLQPPFITESEYETRLGTDIPIDIVASDRPGEDHDNTMTSLLHVDVTKFARVLHEDLAE